MAVEVDGCIRLSSTSPHCESSKSAYHDPGFCVPSRGDNMATARGGARVPAAATAPDCLLVLREPETCKQVRDIGHSRNSAASSPRGGRCSTPQAATPALLPLAFQRGSQIQSAGMATMRQSEPLASDCSSSIVTRVLS